MELYCGTKKHRLECAVTFARPAKPICRQMPDQTRREGEILRAVQLQTQLGGHLDHDNGGHLLVRKSAITQHSAIRHLGHAEPAVPDVKGLSKT